MDDELVLTLQLWSLNEGGYLITCDEFPALMAQGATIDETIDIARDVAQKLVDSYAERGEEVPAPLRGWQY